MNKVETVEFGGAAKPDASGVVVLVALALLVIGVAMAVVGVDMLFGRGWALLTAAPLPILLAVILFNGVKRGR